MTRLLRSAGYEVRSYRTMGEFLLERPANTRGCAASVALTTAEALFALGIAELFQPWAIAVDGR